MLTILIALAAALALALTYAALAERMDDASLVRRQVDAWVAVGALACLVVLTAATVDVRREHRIRQTLVEEAAPEAPAIVLRRRRPSLRATPVAHRAVEGEPAPDRGPAGPEGAPPSAPASDPAAFAAPGVTVASTVAQRASEGPSGRVRSVVEDVPGGRLRADELGEIPATATRVAFFPRPLPTSTPVLSVYASPTPTALPIDPLPPTAPPPTAPPQALPSPTPHCGTPDRIALNLRILDARSERQGDELVVRYSARIENDSDFPVTAGDMSVTALNSAAGSEHYGHERKPDMLIGARDQVTFEGAVTLTKSPSPFGSTELCLSLVGETCGQRRPYDVLRRCLTVTGFAAP